MPARGIRGTGVLRHGLKTSSPVERLIICSPGRGPMIHGYPDVAAGAGRHDQL